MSRSLRVVDPAAPAGDVAMPDAIRALAERLCAENPLAVLAAWETPDGKVQIASLPNARTFQRGMSDVIYDATHPEQFEAQE